MYSYITVGSENKTSSSILNDAKVQRTNMNCTGIHCCEYLDPSLKDMDHYAVTPELLDVIREVRHANSAEDLRERDANRYEIFLIHDEYIINLTSIPKFLLRRATKVSSTNGL